ncbi:hypothetical protein P8452_69606 [Trifolium repens]|nr:hypothetical protein P8452_69606 [Trifolium repens]
MYNRNMLGLPCWFSSEITLHYRRHTTQQFSIFNSKLQTTHTFHSRSKLNFHFSLTGCSWLTCKRGDSKTNTCLIPLPLLPVGSINYDY